jgi:acyl-CoA thioesterase-1
MTASARRLRIWSPIAAAALAAAGCDSTAISAGSPAAPTPTPAPVERVVVLGDSLAVYPTREQSFPSVLQARITAAALNWSVTNASASGDTTADGVRRFDSALRDETSVLVLALGANDGLRGVDVATIEKNLDTIIVGARARGVRVLLCGMETPPLRGWDYMLAFHRLFGRLAANHGLPLVPFLLDGVALNPDMNGPDGIHPNAAGARRIADTVWPYLEPLLRATTSRR